MSIKTCNIVYCVKNEGLELGRNISHGQGGQAGKITAKITGKNTQICLEAHAAHTSSLLIPTPCLEIKFPICAER